MNNYKLSLVFLLVSLFSVSLFAVNLSKSDALTYLNSLRSSAGLSSLNQNQILENASQNHVNYLNEEGYISHYETNSGNTYYTGDSPNDRGISAGYKALYYSENISSGQDGVRFSIDGLMAAIYHRYGFLDNNINEIGIGIDSSLIFNYNMGNSLLNDLCNGDTYSGADSYYTGVCANSDFKIELSLYNSTASSLANNSPNYIIWPPNASSDIPPVFFEESPDPLPNHSVSGYPISIEFNDITYEYQTVTINSFKLYDATNTELTNTLLMNEANDPASHHNAYQFTLFPLERLKWNHTYRVELSYEIDGTSSSKVWSFTTRNLVGYALYELAGEGETINVDSGVDYALYFPPSDANDVFNGVSTSCSTSSAPEMKIYDGNTILVTLNGSDDQQCTFTFSNSKSVTLKIGSAASSALFGNEISANSTVATNDSAGASDVRGSISVIGSSITDYKYKIDSGVYSSQTSISSAINLSSLADGTHTIFVIGYDGVAWQSEESATTLSFIVDNTAPSIVNFSLAPNSEITEDTVIFMSSNSSNIFYTIDGQTPTTASVNAMSLSLNSTNNGTVVLKAIALDSAGNISIVAEASYTVNIAQEPETPAQEPDTPAEELETPTQEHETPAEEPETPTQEHETPAEEPETPGQEHETPAEEPTFEIEGTVFNTSLEDANLEYNGDNTLFTTPIISTSEGVEIFVEIFSNAIGEVEVTLSNDNIKFIFTEFETGSDIRIDKVNDSLVIKVKTKLTKPLTFWRK